MSTPLPESCEGLKVAIERNKHHLVNYLRLQDFLEENPGFRDVIEGDQYNKIRKKLEDGLEIDAAGKFIDYFLTSRSKPDNRKWGTMREALDKEGHELAREIICGTFDIRLQQKRERLVNDVYKNVLMSVVEGRQVAVGFPFSKSEKEKIFCDLERNGNQNTISLILRYMVRHQGWFTKFVQILHGAGKKRIAKDLEDGDPGGLGNSDDSPSKNTRSKGKEVLPLCDDPDKYAKQIRNMTLNSAPHQTNSDRTRAIPAASAAPAASRNFEVTASMGQQPPETMVERNTPQCMRAGFQATERHRSSSSDSADYESCENDEDRSSESPNEGGGWGFGAIYQARQAQRNACTDGDSSPTLRPTVSKGPLQASEHRQRHGSTYTGSGDALPPSPAQHTVQSYQVFSPDNIAIHQNINSHANSHQLTDLHTPSTNNIDGYSVDYPLATRENTISDLYGDCNPPPYSLVDPIHSLRANTDTPTCTTQIENLYPNLRTADYPEDQALHDALSTYDLDENDSFLEPETLRYDANQQTRPKCIAEVDPPPQVPCDQHDNGRHLNQTFSSNNGGHANIETPAYTPRPTVLRCQVCNRPYTSLSKLKAHEHNCSLSQTSKSLPPEEPSASRKNQRPQIFRCKVCSTAFADENSWKRHACSLPVPFSRACSNTQHHRNSSSPRTHKIPPNHEHPSENNSLYTRTHDGPNTSTLPTRHSCESCKKLFPTQQRLDEHLYAEHTQKPNQLPGTSSPAANISSSLRPALPKQYNCCLCKKPFPSQKHLDRHQCAKDSAAIDYSNVTERNQHGQTLHQNFPHQHRCPLCNMIFPTQKRLSDHKCPHPSPHASYNSSHSNSRTSEASPAISKKSEISAQPQKKKVTTSLPKVGKQMAWSGSKDEGNQTLLNSLPPGIPKLHRCQKCQKVFPTDARLRAHDCIK